jgi:hypothetical protein
MVMKKVNIIKFIMFVACYSVLSTVYAQPAGSRILIDAIAEPAGVCDRIEITFSFPVQYLTHFPKTHGKEVRVQITPLAGSRIDTLLLSGTEPTRLMDPTKNEIKQIFYDGTFSPKRPYLIFDFANDVYFRVVQGNRFRSIVLFVSSNDDVNTCQ